MHAQSDRKRKASKNPLEKHTRKPLIRPSSSRSLLFESLETRDLLTTFTMASPTSGGALPSGVTEVGGVVLDLVGANGARITSQLAASSLFTGFFNSGSPVSYRGNPGTIGVESGFNSTVINALGGGISEIAVRLTIDDGDTQSGNFDYNNNEFRLNGITFGSPAGGANFSSVATQRTSSDGLTLISSGSGFGDNTLDTGWFYTTNATFLANLYNSIVNANEIRIQLYDTDPYDNYFNFSAGVDGGLINVGQPPNVSPIINSVANSGPVNEGSPVTVTVNATDPDNSAGGLTYEFDFDNNGTYEVTNTTGVASHTYADDNPTGTPFDNLTVNVRVSDTRGGVDTDSTTVRVNNVPPANLSLALSDTVISENGSTELSESFNDPGTLDAHTVRIDWGDGSAIQTVNARISCSPAIAGATCRH